MTVGPSRCWERRRQITASSGSGPAGGCPVGGRPTGGGWTVLWGTGADIATVVRSLLPSYGGNACCSRIVCQGRCRVHPLGSERPAPCGAMRRCCSLLSPCPGCPTHQQQEKPARVAARAASNGVVGVPSVQLLAEESCGVAALRSVRPCAQTSEGGA